MFIVNTTVLIIIYMCGVCVGSEGVLSGACEVMNPEDFQLLVIPFTQTAPIDGRPPLLPPGLPHEFAKVSIAQ